MNILPLISSLIFIFALCSYIFVHNGQTALEEHIHFTGSYRIARKFMTNCVDAAYKGNKAKDLHPSKPSKKKETSTGEAVYVSPRDFFNKRPETKLNLRSLSLKPEQCQQIALPLLEKLYFFSPFYQKGMEKKILKKLQQILEKHPDCTRFEDLLSFVTKEDLPLFYKLVKGTQSYKVCTTKGYPPLGDFFSLEKIKPGTPPIHFCYASRPLLEAVFGSTLTPLLINEEKHKWEKDHKHHPMTKEELEAFLLSHRRNLVNFEGLFSFNQKKHASPFDVICDKEAGLQIKIEK